MKITDRLVSGEEITGNGREMNLSLFRNNRL